MRSLAELERDWSIDDVAIANELLDELEHAEAVARENARRRRS